MNNTADNIAQYDFTDREREMLQRVHRGLCQQLAGLKEQLSGVQQQKNAIEKRLRAYDLPDCSSNPCQS